MDVFNMVILPMPGDDFSEKPKSTGNAYHFILAWAELMNHLGYKGGCHGTDQYYTTRQQAGS